MFPIHWAASDGRIGAARFFLEKSQDINVQDANGCTPVIVAAQHNHIACVVFLVQNGADLSILDNNGDSALHWAAYKGHVELIGYLTYVLKHKIESEDAFGQTPLHLAALQGHLAAVEYLVLDCHADSSKKDRNGQTPVDLAVKKIHQKIEYFLRRVTARSFSEFFFALLSKRSHKMMGMFLMGSNEKELSNWPWRIVFGSNFLGSIITVGFIMNEHLSDLYVLHLMNTMIQSLWWFFFCMCLFRNPSFVRDDHKEYAEMLELIGKTEDENSLPSICHSCHVRRPLRSKHCKLQRRCVNKFDHFVSVCFHILRIFNYN